MASAGADGPALSVVICTRNRALFLPSALDALHRLRTTVTCELVIVDNGSSDDTPRVLADFARTATVSVRLLVEPTPGLSRARNVGWRAARAPVVAFTDDDCYPEPDYLDQIAAVFADDGLGYVGGRILLHDPGDYPITVLESTDRIEIPPRTIVEAGVIQGANMATRRRVLEAVGGFDETLGAGTRFPSEDVEFVCRASFAGFAGAYDPRPVVRHHHRRRSAEDVRRLRRAYAIGRGAYQTKCLLDPARRAMTLRTWYWRARVLSLRARLRTPYLEARAFEYAGALGYLMFRTRSSR